MIEQLRIGNWVALDPNMKPVKVGSIGSTHLNNATPWWHVHPIELTPEILEKAGFVQYDDENGHRINQTVRKGKFGLEFRGVEYGYTIMWYDADDDYGSPIVVQVLFLHQLQNLYYALTGTELNIEL